MELGLLILIISLIVNAANKKSGSGKSRHRRSGRQIEEFFEQFGDQKDRKKPLDELREWMSGDKGEEVVYTETVEYDTPDMPREKPDFAHHFYEDEEEEYEFRVEPAYSEQGMEGESSIQGCESVKDVRIVKRSKPKSDNGNTGNERLLEALGDLPSAIVAAEILGKPKALQSGYLYRR